MKKLNEMSIEELKVAFYDTQAMVERLNNDLRAINQIITQKQGANTAKPEVKEVKEKK